MAASSGLGFGALSRGVDLDHRIFFAIVVVYDRIIESSIFRDPER